MRRGILNLFVLLIVLFLAFETYEVWTLPIRVLPEEETSRKSEGNMGHPPMLGAQKGQASVRPYISIAERNIFSPERKEFSGQPSLKKAVSRPQIILYGVVLAGEYEVASIASPGRPLYKSEREIKSLKVGERIGEYQVGKILPDRIMMAGMGDSFEVLLYDAKIPKNGVEVKAESRPAPTAGTEPAVLLPTLWAPAPAAPTASAEAAKPAGPVQQNLAAPLPATRPATTSSRSRLARRGIRLPSPPAQTLNQAAPNIEAKD